MIKKLATTKGSDRRQFMQVAAGALLGVNVLSSEEAFAAASDGKAKQIVYLFMAGAMSHIDTFDPKPSSKNQGQTGTVNTSISGVKFGESFKNLSKLTSEMAVIRGLTQETGAHGPARYLIRTSYKEIASTQHPGMGSWIQLLDGRISKTLPSTVHIGGDGEGPGYLGTKYAPVPIADPARGLEDTKGPAYLKESQFSRRLRLSEGFDRNFRSVTQNNTKVNGYDALYQEAVTLLKSADIKAFDINAESDAVKEKYGANRFGQGCLLARRLIESGVRYVEVQSGGWDMHRDIFNTMPTRGGELDQAAGALISDLKERGLLDQTMVVIGTEFGRKPNININTGRDHHPAAFSGMLAGAGIAGGQVYGSTDADAFYVEDQVMSVQEFNATIAAAMGLPYEEEIFSPTGRPFSIGNGAGPVEKLLA